MEAHSVRCDIVQKDNIKHILGLEWLVWNEVIDLQTKHCSFYPCDLCWLCKVQWNNQYYGTLSIRGQIMLYTLIILYRPETTLPLKVLLGIASFNRGICLRRLYCFKLFSYANISKLPVTCCMCHGFFFSLVTLFC